MRKKKSCLTLSVRTAFVYLSFLSHAEKKIEFITAEELLGRVLCVCGLLCDVQKTACVQIFMKLSHFFQNIEYYVCY